MILVVGGIANGKRTYLERLGYTAQDIDEGALGGASVLYGLEDLLRAGDPSDDAFETLCTKDVITCCEIGSGVVPLDPDERAWRERVGRTVNRLSERAEHVVRMVCGIPVELK